VFEYEIFITLAEPCSFGYRDTFAHFPIPIAELQQRGPHGGLYLWYAFKELHSLPMKSGKRSAMGASTSGLTEITKSATLVLSSPPFPIAPALMLAMSSGKLLKHTDLSDDKESFSSFSLRPARRHIRSSQCVSESDSDVYVDRAMNVCFSKFRLMEVLREDRVDLNKETSGLIKEPNVVATRDEVGIGTRSDNKLYSS
jgi:hypothetical protein